VHFFGVLLYLCVPFTPLPLPPLSSAVDAASSGSMDLDTGPSQPITSAAASAAAEGVNGDVGHGSVKAGARSHSGGMLGYYCRASIALLPVLSHPMQTRQSSTHLMKLLSKLARRQCAKTAPFGRP